MTKHRMFRPAPAMLVAALAFPVAAFPIMAFPGLAAAQAVTPATPTMTLPGRESAPGTVPTAPNVTAPSSGQGRRAVQPARTAPAKPTDRVEARITELHAKLKITPAQSSQWDAFAAVMRENARGMHTAFETRSTGRPKMNAVENMQSYAVLAEQHAQDLRRLAPAFAGVYSVMSDDQKRNADEVFRAQRADGGPRGRR